MSELPAGQLVAAFLALVFFGLFVLGLVRFSRVPMLVMLLSLLGIPTVGFAVYAVTGGAISSPNVITFALAFAFFGLAVVVVSVILSATAGPARTFGSMHRALPLTLLFWPCAVAAITGLVFFLEPWFAVVNLAANAVWFTIWVPRPFRTVGSHAVYTIAAPREKVFAFITDPANWPLYNPDVVSATVRPAAPLATGSEILMRQRVQYAGLRGPRLLLPETVDVTALVTELVPGEVFSNRRTDGPDASDCIRLASEDGKTVVTTTAHALLPYRYAILGARLEMALNRERAAAVRRRRQARLRELLEQP